MNNSSMNNSSRVTQEVYKYFNEQDCFLHRIPVELLQMMARIFQEETLKAETVGYRYQKQLLEWSGSVATEKRIVLLYKATRDGFSAQDFHKKCNNQGETWTIVEEDKGNVFGGYASVSWKGVDGFVGDSSAYVFTLVNPHGIPPIQYKSKNQSKSLHDHNDYLPVFGSGDLLIHPNSNQNYQSYTRFPINYEDTTGKGNTTFTGAFSFQSKEIEVWGSISGT